jgi:hypothetical protein
MVKALRVKPRPGDDAYVDGLVWAVQEPLAGDPFSAPVIAAAAKEIAFTATYAPIPKEFVAVCRKHQRRLVEDVLGDLRRLSYASSAAYEVLEKLAPEKLPETADEDELVPLLTAQQPVPFDVGVERETVMVDREMGAR